jgi:hypothetical protein
MIGDDPTGKDNEPMTPEPITPDALRRAAVPFTDTDAGRPAEMPWSRVPAGRRISFTAWGVAGVVGIVLWAVIIKLV